MLSSMGIEASLKAVLNENGLYIEISGDNMGQIIGYRGETLDAMQYLTSLVANKGKEDYLRVTLDTENYRAKREQTLIRLGKRLADKALKSGRRVSLEPMNPYERRIIHSSLQDIKGVTTVSEGEEPNRRVVIIPER
jgi:spoIIIJ-associated protein